VSGWILAIEVSNPSAREPGRVGGPGREARPDADVGPAVALARLTEGGGIDDGSVVSESVGGGTRHADDLMPAVERCCARAGVRRREIARVAVSAGPGGYTALRTSCAAAAVLAELLQARAVPVPTALVAAAALGAADGVCVVCLASKGERAHVSVVDPARGVVDRVVRTLGVVDAAGLVRAAEEHGARTLVGDGFVPSSFREGARRVGLAERDLALRASACARLGAGLAGLEDAAMLVPVYAREPDAVTQWRALGRLPVEGGGV
jgi:tRNA threonylcarbamoyladenosine biosynthesis protein TsaB